MSVMGVSEDEGRTEGGQKGRTIRMPESFDFGALAPIPAPVATGPPAIID